MPELFVQAHNYMICSSPARALVSSGPSPKQVTLPQLLSLSSATPMNTKFEFVGKIIALNNRYRWNYQACSKCSRAVRQDDGNSIYGFSPCELNGQIVDPIPWCRVSLEVSDEESQVGIILFGNVAEYAIGTSAEKLLADEDPDSDDAPSKLLNLVEKCFLFTVSAGTCKVYEDHIEFTASHVGPVPAAAQTLCLPLSAPPPTSSQPVSNVPPLSSSATPVKSFTGQSSHSPYFRCHYTIVPESKIADVVASTPLPVNSDKELNTHSKKPANEKGDEIKSTHLPVKREVDYNVISKSKSKTTNTTKKTNS